MIDRFVMESPYVGHVQILVVEDENIIATDIKDCLEHLGYSVPAIATTGAEAIAKATELSPDLILMDIRLKGDMDGIQAAEQIWGRMHIPIVYATGFSDRDTLERAKLTRPFGYILKPIEEQELYAAIETALHQYRANQQIQKREQWLTSVLRDIGDGVIVVDRHSRVQLLNLVAETLTGWKQEDALGKPLSDVFKIVDFQTREPLPNPAIEAMHQDSLIYFPGAIVLLSRQGVAIPISDTATPIRNEHGLITGAVIIFYDITRRQLAEERDLALQKAQKLEDQMVELKKLNQLKDDFLNTVSHELRTPLANMKMAIQMLEIVLNQQDISQTTNIAPERTVRYLEILRDQCNQELILVNDLLDLQRLNADTYSLSFTSIALHNWIPHIAENFQERIRNNQQNLEIIIPSDLPELVSDISSLTRIVSELLNNACKYTPANETISVSAQLLTNARTIDTPNPTHSLQPNDINSPQSSLNYLAEKTTFIQIKICNSGVEIPLDELSHVFDQFYRIPNTDFRNRGGTGLGLALVKKLVNYLNGKVWAESHSRQTCFIVELPLLPPSISESS